MIVRLRVCWFAHQNRWHNNVRQRWIWVWSVAIFLLVCLFACLTEFLRLIHLCEIRETKPYMPLPFRVSCVHLKCIYFLRFLVVSFFSLQNIHWIYDWVLYGLLPFVFCEHEKGEWARMCVVHYNSNRIISNVWKKSMIGFDWIIELGVCVCSVWVFERIFANHDKCTTYILCIDIYIIFLSFA